MADEYTEFMNDWADAHARETDAAYASYHKKPGAKNYIPKENFKWDGYVCKEKYDRTPKKVLFIGKECNLDGDLAVSCERSDAKFWIKVFSENGTKTEFLSGLAMLVNAEITGNFDTPDKSMGHIGEVAFINLNKRGGYARSNWRTLRGYVAAYRDRLKKQIELINPDLIICLGNGVDYLLTEYGILASDDPRIVPVYHPSDFSVSDSEKLRCLQNKK